MSDLDVLGVPKLPLALLEGQAKRRAVDSSKVVAEAGVVTSRVR